MRRLCMSVLNQAVLDAEGKLSPISPHADRLAVRTNAYDWLHGDAARTMAEWMGLPITVYLRRVAQIQSPAGYPAKECMAA